jgi:hypothetical protein
VRCTSSDHPQFATREARRVARQALSRIEQQKELCREARGILLVENLFRDLGYALRVFSRSPGFALVVVITLALGIGANTAIFSLIEATVLRPLPYPDADRLVTLSEIDRQGDDVMISWPDFVDWQNQTTSFSAIAALGGINFNLTGPRSGGTASWAAGLCFISFRFRCSPIIGARFC